MPQPPPSSYRKSPRHIIFLLLMVCIMSLSGMIPVLKQLPPLSHQKNPSKRKKALPLPETVELHLADTFPPVSLQKVEGGMDTPLYWHIPKAGGTTVRKLYNSGECFGFVWADECPVKRGCLEFDTLQLYEQTKSPKISTFNRENLYHAKSLNLVPSHIADIISTPALFDASEILFNPQHKGRMFAIFRHPVERVVSQFYYLQTATWERSYNPMFATITIDQYAKTGITDDNWMVRSLSGKLEANSGPITPKDLEIAVEFVRRKCLVGLIHKMEESIHRFNLYFGFDENQIMKSKSCQDYIGGGGMNANQHEGLDRESDTWKILERKNGADMILYKEVERVFEEQSSLITSLKL